MLGERLRRFRLARSMSLDDLEAAIDGTVKSQTLSKYESGKLQPTEAVLNRIAFALGVKSVQLWGELSCDTKTEQLLNHTIEPPAGRSLSERRRFLELPKREKDRILREQAKQVADFYENDTEWREWEGDPLVEYEIP